MYLKELTIDGSDKLIEVFKTNQSVEIEMNRTRYETRMRTTPRNIRKKNRRTREAEDAPEQRPSKRIIPD